MLVFRDGIGGNGTFFFPSKRKVSAVQYSGPQFSMTQLISGSLFELNDATYLPEG